MARSDDSRDPNSAAPTSARDGAAPAHPAAEIAVEAQAPIGSARPGALFERLTSHPIGRTRYVLQGEIARGGMGVILKVWDDELRRALAMKVMLPIDERRTEGVTPTSDTRTLGRFLEEAQVTGQLDHPGVVPVHELGIDADGRVYFTMRLVKGRDLKQVFDLVLHGREGWNMTRALGVVLKVCEAMAYAHSKGVIHRDLKPSNVMVGNFGEVYVMDWGLARVLGRSDLHDLRLKPDGGSWSSVRTERREARSLDPDSSLETMDGDVMGTPCYMSPEQARGEVERLSARSDVYAVGAMLYQLLTGRMPYVPAGARVSNRHVLGMLLDGPPKRIVEITRDVPAELVAICEKAIARDMDARYADTQALAEDLRAYLEHRVVTAYETGALAEMRKWIERNRALATVSAAALVLLLVGLSVSAVLYVRAERNAEDLLSLSAIQDLVDLKNQVDTLWPAAPDQIPAYDAWLASAQDLLAGHGERSGLEFHRRKLAELRARALPSAPDATPTDAESWRFASTEDRWWHTQLSRLVADLEALADPRTGAIHGTSPEHGWGIERRRDFARTVRLETIEDPRAAWTRAIASIKDTSRDGRYGGLVLAPQLGLVPIGRDPESGLWEFAHLATGEPAERGEDGKLVMKEATGLVFVLIPRGRVALGAQRDSPQDPNYDPQATELESPVWEVDLDAFFLSKFEMTQAQWERFTGQNPSRYGPGFKPLDQIHTRLHPVEQVSWIECTEVLRRLDLVLPTEAQWEYAARAGSASPWSTGREADTLDGSTNLADISCQFNGATSSWAREEWLYDGWILHAPIGSFRPNAFGLFDVHGNVSEWCRDVMGAYRSPARDGAGERLTGDPTRRVSRGGAYTTTSELARSAYREAAEPTAKNASIGLRPARAISAP